MLKIENVSKKWSGFHLDKITFALPSGYIMGLIGENGAGKTTLINILSGLYAAEEGDIFLEEKTFAKEEAEIKQEIGVVIHGDIFERNESLLGNANHFGRFYHRYDVQLLRRYLERFALDEKRPYKKLSKGEQLKFALAFALSHQPKLLLLDEPTANFDRDFRQEFFKVLREYTASGENSVILSTHITSDIDMIADYLLFLKKGKQVMFGDIESIREEYRMVSGEAYKIKLLKNKVIHMEEGNFGCKALVHHCRITEDMELKVWEPTVEELMYHVTKGAV